MLKLSDYLLITRTLTLRGRTGKEGELIVRKLFIHMRPGVEVLGLCQRSRDLTNNQDFTRES